MAPARRARPSAPLDIGRISLRRGERGLLVGGTQVGKSTLSDVLRKDFLNRYAALGAHCLITDTKPRYQAEFQVNGLSARRRYKDWNHGVFIPGSVVVDTPADIKAARRQGARVLIAQCQEGRDIGRIVEILRAYLDASKRGVPQLVDIDETLDFFHGNGMAKGGEDAIDRTARAGAERGTAALFNTQRPLGMSSIVLENLERFYGFRLDSVRGIKRLSEMGLPSPWVPPTEPHIFDYWWKGDYHHIHGPYKLALAA